MSNSDKTIMEKISSRDQGAFEILSEKYRPFIRCKILSMIKEKPAADDILQDVFIKVWTKAGSYEGKGSVKNWILKIAENTTLNYIRDEKRFRNNVPLGSEEEEIDIYLEGRGGDWTIDGPDTVCEREEALCRIRELIDALPENKKEVISLIHHHHLSIKEAANRLGIAPGTVKSRLFYCRKILIEKLHSDYKED